MTAADSNNSAINGVSNAVTVTPAATAKFVVTGTPASLTAGSNASFTVTAEDTFGNLTPTYTGTVKFTTTDPLATPPAATTLVSGTQTFVVTLKTAGAKP